MDTVLIVVVPLVVVQCGSSNGRGGSIDRTGVDLLAEEQRVH